MLVSIIIPTYNRAHLIGETLDSVLAQTYTNWECIIVDDGSTDNTDAVVGEYVKKDSRFQYHHRPKDRPKGANACRNYGFELSKGEYINWFDSDDLMLESFLEIKILKSENNAQIIISKRFENGESLNFKSLDEGVYFFSDFDREYIINRYSILTGDVLFSRIIICESFDEKLCKAQEMEFFTRVFDQDLSFRFINERLWNHRVFNDSISSSSNKNFSSKINSLVYLSKKLQKKYLADEDVIRTVKNYGVVLYKKLVINNRYFFVLKYYNHFRKSYNSNYLIFSFFFIYNVLTKRGFDVLKGSKKCFL